jgi:two-component system sensor histidine kinase VicK
MRRDHKKLQSQADAEELLRQKRLNRALFGQQVANFVLMDRNHRVIQVNESYASYYGKTAAELIGTDILELRSADTDYESSLQLINHVIREKKKLTFTDYAYVFRDRPGVTYWDSALEPILDENGEVEFIFFSAVNVTERKQAEIALIKAKDAAEAASRLKSKFLDMAAHELRTPVTAFSLLLELTEKLMTAGEPVDESVIHRLSKQADRLNRLVVELLEVSRLERDMLTLSRERTDIVALISDCIDDFKPQAPLRRFIFSKPQFAAPVDVDPTRIYQVLGNLIDNAIKYTPVASPIEIKIEFASLGLRISVIDQGPAIPKNQLSELFKPFTRGTTDLEERCAGLGLGLYVCNRIIELHGAKIGVESEAGIGSKFFFELPYVQENTCSDYPNLSM